MKNWVISLLVLVVPVAAYFTLKNSNEAQNSLIAQAANKPSIIKFTSPMCLDCKKIATEIAPLKPIYQDRVNFVEIDATSPDKKSQDQITMYGVTVVPTMIYLDENGKKVRKQEGFAPKATLEKYIKELIHG